MLNAVGVAGSSRYRRHESVRNERPAKQASRVVPRGISLVPFRHMCLGRGFVYIAVPTKTDVGGEWMENQSTVLSILVENMRREGYELGVSTPHVLYKEIDGKRYEPIEELSIDVPEECVGSVMEKLGARKGELQDMHPQGSRTRLTFLIPSRGLFGYKSEFLTDTKGEGIMNSLFHDYEPYKGDIPRRNTGSLISFETGEAVTYGLYNAQERGALFIGAGVPVYEGMVVGASPKAEDLVVNVCKRKHLTNTRASGSDDALRLVPPRNLSLEDCLEFLADDELLEVTPESLRIRKQILSNQLRAKQRGKLK